MNNILTNRQFSMEQAVKIYLQHLKDGYIGVKPILEQNQGKLTTDESQIRGICELAADLLKFLDQ